MRKSLLLGLNTCAAATLTLALVTVAGGFTTARAQATNSVKCTDGVVSVSTGDSSGTCVKKGLVINCTSGGGGNTAQGGCDLNGRATCGSTSTGSGSCTIAARGGAAGTGGTTTKGKVGVTPPAAAGALQGPSGGSSSGGAGSATTAGSKAKLPGSGTTTQGR
jgi:hypothetical protein